MPGQPSPPLPHSLVDERSWCDNSGTPRADNDNLIDSAPLDGGVKVVHSSLRCGRSTWTLRASSGRLLISRRVVDHACATEASAPVPLDTAPLLQRCVRGAWNFREQRGRRMGISSEESDRQRQQGPVRASDIGTWRIGDLASPTEHRTRRQNGARRAPDSSAVRHVGRAVSSEPTRLRRSAIQLQI